MGVPKFFRWLSERYPLINQRFTSESLRKDNNQNDEDNDNSDYIDEDEINLTGGKKKKKKKQQHKKQTKQKKNKGHYDPNNHDILGKATLAPEIDRLYIDMNGLLHGCSHNNSDDLEGDVSVEGITNEVILINLTTLLERLVEDILEPKSLIYMAMDGVAPRAKLNQQRARRYRSSTGHEIEQTVYEAQLDARRRQQGDNATPDEANEATDDDEQKLKTAAELEIDHDTSSSIGSSIGQVLTEVEPGRFAGKFETHVGGGGSDEKSKDTTTTTTTTTASSSGEEEPIVFHSNQITPGTPFFQEITNGLLQFIQHKMATDDKWKHLTIVFSGSNVPGEGEHKILQFIREQQTIPNYNPNLRHCIMSQDGDLIMLGLVTHEPNLVLFREQVVFDIRRRMNQLIMDGSIGGGNNKKGGDNQQKFFLDSYVHNDKFEFLHMNILRDYLALDFETSNVVADSPFDLERTLDDFVFLTFFVGNDFLPHMPALDIADEAFDLLFYTYREQRQEWYNEWKAQNLFTTQEGGGEIDHRKLKTTTEPDYYLTNAGNIVSGARLEAFCKQVGSHESPYLEYKKRTEAANKKSIRLSDKRYGTTTIPDDDILHAKEEADRAKFREMIEKQTAAAYGSSESDSDSGASSGSESDSSSSGEDSEDSTSESDSDTENDNFTPVLSESVVFQPSNGHVEEEKMRKGLSKRLGSLLQHSFTPQGDGRIDENDGRPKLHISDQDWKGRYYYDKFEMTPWDSEKHTSLRKSYIEGLVWTLKYYYKGCVSWDWYYPFHYGTFMFAF